MTPIFEPCGYRSIRTGTLFLSLDTPRAYGIRKPNGRKFNDQEWEQYWPQHYEVVYRLADEPINAAPAPRCQECPGTVAAKAGFDEGASAPKVRRKVEAIEQEGRY